jgi:hypothetical protein
VTLIFEQAHRIVYPNILREVEETKNSTLGQENDYDKTTLPRQSESEFVLKKEEAKQKIEELPIN